MCTFEATKVLFMKKRILPPLIISALFAAYVAHAQEPRTWSEYDLSPQAYSIIAANRAHPALNTGTLNLSIPIYVWKDNDFEIPIILRYSTNGLKPSHQTGPVGLGWMLNLGGAITRQIDGIDDFNPDCGYYHALQSDANAIYEMNASIYYSGNYGTTMLNDSETNPDKYYFSFNGMSGSFTINGEKNFVVYDTDGDRGTYSVSITESSGQVSFIITTANGYKYHFGSSASSREILYNTNPVSFTIHGSSTIPLTDDKKICISWMLDRIEAPNGRAIEFVYQTSSPLSVIPASDSKVCTTFGQQLVKIPSGNNDSSIDTYKVPSITTVSYLTGVNIKQSSSSDSKPIISLSYSNKSHSEAPVTNANRIYSSLVVIQDKLDGIDIFNHNGETLTSADFSYTYNGVKMLLSSVDIQTIGKYSMAYNTSSSVTIPNILTNNIDFWGYYNGNTQVADSDISPMTVDIATYDEHITRDQKDPDSSFSVLGTLKRITYPTGGYSEFEYEGNTASRILLRQHYSAAVDNDTGTSSGPGTSVDGPVSVQTPFLPAIYDYASFTGTQECGGVRIKAIRDYSDSSCMFSRTYSYEDPVNGKSSGTVLKFRRYCNITSDGLVSIAPSSIFPDNSFDDSYLSYSTVTEHYPDSSYTVYRYSDYNDYGDEFSQNYRYVDSANTTSSLYSQYNDNIGREADSRHYRRGRLILKSTYNADNEILKSTRYEYCDSDSSFVPRIVVSGNRYWSAKRFTCDRLLSKITRTDHIGGTMTTTTSYIYNVQGQVRSITESRLSGNDKKTVYYRYAHEKNEDYVSSAFRWQPTDVIETRTKNGQEFMISNIEYDYSGGNVKPSVKKNYPIAVPLSLEGVASLDGICSIGRLVSPRTDTYTYGNLKRLIRISTSGGRYISYTWDSGYDNLLSITRNHPENVIRYEWRDMIGPNRMTQPTGVYEDYEYDSENRLSKITDHEGNTVKEYEYHMINE